MNLKQTEIIPHLPTNHEFVESIRKGNRSVASQIYRLFRKSFISVGVSNFQMEEERTVEIFQQAILIFYRNVAHGKTINSDRTIVEYLEAIGKKLVWKELPAKENELSTAFQNVDISHFEMDWGYQESAQKEALQTKLFLVGDNSRTVFRGFYYRKYVDEAIRENAGLIENKQVEELKIEALELIGISFSSEEIRLTEGYFANQLSESEQLLFKNKAIESAGFRANFERFRMLLQLVDKMEEAEIRHSLLLEEEVFYSHEEFERDQLQETAQKGRFKRIASVKNISIAAGVLIFVFAAVFLLDRPKSYNLVIFEQYFELPNWENDFGDSENPKLEKLKIAREMYESGQFDNSIENINQFLLGANTRTQHFAEANYYKSMMLIALEKEKEAISELKLLNAKISSISQQQIDWYLALSYLKLSQRKETKFHLKKIIENSFGEKELKTKAKEIYELIE